MSGDVATNILSHVLEGLRWGQVQYVTLQIAEERTPAEFSE